MASELIVPLLTGPLLMLLVVGICRTAATGRLPPNGAVGIRLPSTRRSDAAWRAGHAAAVVPSILGLVATLVADAVAVLWSDASRTTAAPSILLVAVLLLAIAAIAVAAHRGAVHLRS